ncbi:MAS20-domain-containing protein [Schizopora paradoxa]|uniref:Histone-lysine N-methyltransferase SET5 n=1 Tax=Schizopora paradoxa TaxID=27342 RepID=A0A0H2S8T0_9AGAM|nr:MAS20-domain-containing protein [Schizopora paradoxa]
MSGPSTSTILTITGVTIIGGVLAYATYFDYKRRNDPAFRKRLRKQKKQVEEVALKDQEEEKERLASAGGAGIPQEVIQLLYQQAQSAPLPSTQQERQDFFMNLVTQADQLVMMGPQHYLDAAVVFYQALRVYPAPLDMLNIYKDQLPAPVMGIVAELYNLDVSLSKAKASESSGKESGSESERGRSPSLEKAPSESSADWDKMLERIHGYFDSFPPKSMNVSIKQNEVSDAKGGQSRSYSLLASKDFKAGEEIYVETPILAALDTDIQLRGTHCTQCLRPVEKGLAIVLESDPLKAVYCSKKCQVQSRTQYHNALFGQDAVVSDEIDAELSTRVEQEVRKEAQAEFVKQWTSTGNSSSMIVARLVILQIIAELAKQLKVAEGLKKDLPEVAISLDRSVYDHFERLRFLDIVVPDGEYVAFRELLAQTFPDLAETYSEERHALFRGKMAYNAIGVCFGGGRTDRPKPATIAETQYTRTPYGTSKQVGSGLYFVTSYLSHSCSPSVRPSFSGGTSDLHLIATRDIKQGEELTMAYVDVSQRSDESVDVARRRRRSELAKGWKFGCKCLRCEEELKVSEVSADEEKLEVGEGAKLEPIPMRPGSKVEAEPSELIG